MLATRCHYFQREKLISSKCIHLIDESIVTLYLVSRSRSSVYTLTKGERSVYALSSAKLFSLSIAIVIRSSCKPSLAIASTELLDMPILWKFLGSVKNIAYEEVLNDVRFLRL